MAGYLQLAAADVSCQLKKTPQINVAATDTTLKIDHSKSKAELDSFQIDTISPYSKDVQSHVGGLMSGEVKTTSNLSLMSETFPTINATCLMIDKVNVKIHIEPVIYVAREYKSNGCMYRAIMEHEKKHVQVDRLIVNKYTGIIVNALNTHFRQIGFKAGPFPTQKLEVEQQKIIDDSNKIVKDISDKMSMERKKLQQQVDSLAEYNRVNNLCQGRE